LSILQRLHPELVVDEWVAHRFAELRTARAASLGPSLLHEEPIERLYWGILVFRLSPEAQAVLSTRLGLRGETKRLMRGLAKLRDHLDELKMQGLVASRVVALLDDVDPVAVALATVICSDQPAVVAYLRRFQREWRHIHPELSGDDLAALGIPRGPLFGKLLRTLRAARLDGAITTRAEEEQYVRNMISSS
jgi:tRNA nucleotidyltransferase (CCA-adding enzyme)